MQYNNKELLKSMKCCILLILFGFSRRSYATTGTLIIYDKESVNPKAGYIKIGHIFVTAVVSLNNKTNKTVYAYGVMDCTEPPLDILAPK
jgi:hypothetical protein